MKMAGVYGGTNSKAGFISVLDKATSDGKALLAQGPGDSTIEAIVRKLDAVAMDRQWAHPYRR
jgi:hypothetical protein